MVKRILSRIRPWLSSREYGYSKEYYHTRVFHKYNRLETYLALYKKCSEHDALLTNERVSLLKSVGFGALMKAVIPALPSSRYEILNNEPFHIRVIFYKMFIGQYRVKCYIHFFKDRMFLCSYVFSHVKEDDYAKVMEILQKKYIPQIAEYSGGLIADAEGNCIYVEKDLELVINYLSLKDGIGPEMARYTESLRIEENEKTNARETDMFDRL